MVQWYQDISKAFYIVSHKVPIDKLLMYRLDEQWGVLKTAWTTKPEGWWSESSWRLKISSVCHWSKLGPVLFNIIISDLDYGAECTLSWHHWTRMCGLNTGGLCCHPEAPGQGGEMGWREPYEIQQEECKVLHMGKNLCIIIWWGAPS